MFPAAHGKRRPGTERRNTMKHSLFTRLVSLVLTFALLVPCFPLASAAEETQETEVTEAVETEETVPVTEETEAAEETGAAEASEPGEETEPSEETEAADPTEETEAAGPSEEAEPSEETMPSEETEATEETEPEEKEYLFLGMPEGYAFHAEDAEDRQNMIDHNVMETLSTMTPGQDYAEGEILVLADSEEEALLMAEAYCGTLDSWYDGLAVITLEDATVAEAVAASLDAEQGLPVASPNYTFHVEPIISTPVTTYASDVPTEMDWSDWVQDTMDNPDPALLYPTNSNYQYQHDVIDTYAAWGVTTGYSDITVAVIDTGVDGSHPDLNVTQYKVTGVNLTGDDDGHGTHVCGIIAATMNNGIGGAGIAPNVNLTSYRVADSSGIMSNESIYYAIRQAAQNGASVISMSLGGYGYSSVIQKAIDYATLTWSATVVAAMGNDGTNIMCYPAACDNVIAVGATDRSNRRAYFSNYGSWCDISAPGVNIYSTYPGSSYAYMSGTSQATPVVTGAIALFMSHWGNNPGPAYIQKVLKASATKCADSGMGAGIVNIANMLDGKPDAPGIRLWNGSTLLYDYAEYNGAEVPCETQVQFATYGLDDAWYILYTLDGKTPSVKDGKIVNGTQVIGRIDLSAYAGSTVTLKAMQVSGMGVPGKVLTQKIKVAESTQITGITITGPKVIVAGKTGQFTASVAPVATADQDVTWSIVSRSNSLSAATINAKTGKLTTPKNASGSITIRATSKALTSVSATYTVQVKIINPVSKITLNLSKATLYVGQTQPLSVAKMVDAKGNAIDPSISGYTWTSSNTKVATVSSSGVVTAVSKGNATITFQTLDGSGKTAKCTVTVKQQVTSLTISGYTAIIPGGSATYKAAAAPTTANSKAVTWSLDSAPSGVSISSSGKVTVKSTVSVNSKIVIRATAKDGFGATATYTVYVRPKVTSMNLYMYSAYNGSAAGAVYNSKGVLTTVNLFSVDLNETSGQDNYCDLWVRYSGPSSLSFSLTSSNPSVASVTSSGYVTAHKAGTAKITAKALDGSNKTATVTIKVTNPVSYMSIKTSAAQMTNSTPYIGIGKSVTNTAVFGDTYGTPSNKKVTWDFKVSQYSSSGSYVGDVTSTFKNNKLVTVSSSGKVSVSSKAKSYWNNISGEYVLTLYAYATDGTGVYASKDFLLIPPSTKMEMIEGTKYTLSTGSGYVICFASNQWHSFRDEYESGFVVTSSNPKVAGIGQWYYSDSLAVRPCDHYYSSSMNCYDLYLVTGQKGTAKITIKATDGSNKSISFTVTVK